MWSSDWRLRWLVAAVLASLAGCGFHFRGTPEFPAQMAVVHIDTVDRYSPVNQEFVTVLRRSDIRITNDPVEARTIITIRSDDTGRRLLSVTARNVPAEYEVYYRIGFSVDVDGVEAVPPEQFVLARDFTFDETKVLGKANEEENIRRAIARDLVGLVTRRLAAIE
jgi:LPS-assembly lipoprotein